MKGQFIPGHKALSFLAKIHINQASDVVYICGGGFESWKNLRRNEYIVDNSENMLFLYDGRQKSGTAHCFNYTKKQGLEYMNIWRAVNEN